MQSMHLTSKFKALIQKHFKVELDNLEDLHKLIKIDEIVKGTKTLKSDQDLLSLEVTMLKNIFSAYPELFLELMPNIRPHLPFQTLKNFENEIEKEIGRGKMNPHGPHKDSWRYHPKNTINAWMSLSKATPDNGMFILPESIDYNPSFKNNEIIPGSEVYFERQFLTDLNPGDMVLFSAEMLHGSILNNIDKTRFAFSMRCTLSEPEFHADFMYNFVRVKPTFSNLLYEKFFKPSNFKPEIGDKFHNDFGKVNRENQFHNITENYLEIKHDGKIKRFPRKCPHKGIDLINGKVTNGILKCPQHQMKICPQLIS